MSSGNSNLLWNKNVNLEKEDKSSLIINTQMSSQVSPMKSKRYDHFTSLSNANNMDIYSKNTTNLNVINDLINETSPMKIDKSKKDGSNERSNKEKGAKDVDPISRIEDTKDFGLEIVSRRKKKVDQNITDKPFSFKEDQKGSNSSINKNIKDGNHNVASKYFSNEGSDQYGSNPKEKTSYEININDKGIPGLINQTQGNINPNIANTIKQTKNFDKQLEDELKNIKFQHTPMQVKNTVDVAPKEYESRRKKNQNLLNNCYGSNKDDTFNTANNLNLVPSPRPKNINIANISQMQTTSNNAFTNSTKFPNFQADSNPSSIFGKDGVSRRTKQKEDMLGSSYNPSVSTLGGSLNENYKIPRKNMSDK